MHGYQKIYNVGHKEVAACSKISGPLSSAGLHEVFRSGTKNGCSRNSSMNEQPCRHCISKNFHPEWIEAQRMDLDSGYKTAEESLAAGYDEYNGAYAICSECGAPDRVDYMGPRGHFAHCSRNNLEPC